MTRYVINPTLQVKPVPAGIECILPFSGERVQASRKLLTVLDLFREPVALTKGKGPLASISDAVLTFLRDHRLIIPEMMPSLARGLLDPGPPGAGCCRWHRAREEMRAGRVVLIGAPADTVTYSLGRPSFGPSEIRKYLGTSARTSPLDLGDTMTFSDEPVTALHERLAFVVGEVVRNGAVPIVLGGDHSITFPIVQAVCRQEQDLVLFHFDAHGDIQDIQGDGGFIYPLNHANVMSHIEHHVAGVRKIMQIGVRDRMVLRPSTLKSQRIDQLHPTLLRSPAALDQFIPLSSHRCKAYVSIDIDVLDPAFAPETTTPRVGGLSLHDVVDALTLIGDRFDIIGADIVEVCGSPAPYNQAAHAAASLCSWIITHVTEVH